MTIRHGFHATMTAKPGKADELIGLLLDAPSLSHDDCPVFLVTRSAADRDVVHVLEGWSSAEAHRAFFGGDQAQALVTKLQPLLAGEATYTDAVPVGGRATF